MFNWFSSRCSVVGLAALVGLCACGIAPEETPPTPKESPQRVLSLSPGITEVIYEIGAGDLVVGRTQFTTHPPEALALPSVGPGLTPDYEAIVRLAPDLIVSSADQSLNTKEIRSLGAVALYPWLSFEEIIKSIEALGEALGKSEPATRVATRMQAVLDAPAAPDGPTLLLALGQPSESAPSIWFSREDSLHGTVLEAAGFRNAIPEGTFQTPNLPLETLLSIDPDVVIVLLAENEIPEKTRAEYQAFWAQFSTLRAVQNEQIYFLADPAYFSTGPRILNLFTALKDILSRIGTPS